MRRHQMIDQAQDHSALISPTTSAISHLDQKAVQPWKLAPFELLKRLFNLLLALDSVRFEVV